MPVRHITVHCSATPPSMDIGAAEIDRWHRERGFDRIGYNYVIRRDGTLETGREEGAELAHARGHNRNAIAVCLVGGVNDHNAPAATFTTAQAATLRAVIEFLSLKYPGAVIGGHRDLPGVAKDCPSFNVRKWLARGVMSEPQKT